MVGGRGGGVTAAKHYSLIQCAELFLGAAHRETRPEQLICPSVDSNRHSGVSHPSMPGMALEERELSSNVLSRG